MAKKVRKKLCPSCNGTRELKAQWKPCDRCDGYGTVKTATDAVITGIIDIFIEGHADNHIYNQKICPICQGEKGSYESMPCSCKNGYIQVIEDI